MSSPEQRCKFAFLGEESARFTRFARASMSAGIGEIVATVEGREPLTSRPVTITGALRSCELDGYIRYITVEECDTGIAHNIGGSNATRSVAARRVVFSITDDQRRRLEAWARSGGVYVPLV